jgi:hypothetical protein
VHATHQIRNAVQQAQDRSLGGDKNFDPNDCSHVSFRVSAASKDYQLDDSSVRTWWIDGNALELTFNVNVHVTIPVDSHVCYGKFLWWCVACGVRTNMVWFVYYDRLFI